MTLFLGKILNEQSQLSFCSEPTSLCHFAKCHADCRYAECHNESVIILSVIIRSVIRLIVIMLIVIMLIFHYADCHYADCHNAHNTYLYSVGLTLPHRKSDTWHEDITC